MFSDVSKAYPWGMFENRKPEVFTLSDITIFYGGNGSGKSTLLNIITEKMELSRNAKFNSAPTFYEYLKYCEINHTDDEYNTQNAIRRGKIITSDDVFRHILNERERILEYEKQREEIKRDYNLYNNTKWVDLPPTKLDFSSPSYKEDIKKFRDIYQAKNGPRNHYIHDRCTEVTAKSNGENAFRYFVESIKPESLILLDEPENSLSPQWQIELAQYLYWYAKAEKCQFIIASHSPFILSTPGAKIYNLDADPIAPQKWHELENMRYYFELFGQNREKFL